MCVCVCAFIKKSNGFMHVKQSYTTIKSLNLFDKHVSWLLHSKHTSASGQCCVDRWCMNYIILQNNA